MSLINFNRRNNMMPTFNSWMDNFFNDDFDLMSTRKNNLIFPPVNVEESDNSFMLTLAAPGLQKEDFNIEIKDNSLVISREKSESSSEENERFTRKEYNNSSFSRSFWLPENINKNEISATYDQGILTITLKKNEEEKTQLSKKIEVA